MKFTVNCRRIKRNPLRSPVSRQGLRKWRNSGGISRRRDNIGSLVHWFIGKNRWNMKKQYKLEELETFQLAMELGDEIWEIVVKWNFLSIDTIGKQIIRSGDSI